MSAAWEPTPCRKARLAYDRAFSANPQDARLLYERDQLWKRTRERPEKRLAELEHHPNLVLSRDDLSIELCGLCNQAGWHEDALRLISGRQFQPWEGGEGLALREHVRTHLHLGRRTLAEGDTRTAKAHFQAALECPLNLGEATHLLANQSDIHYYLGIACHSIGESAQAERHWVKAVQSRGDFQGTAPREYSEMTYYSALAWGRLGQPEKMRELLQGLFAYAIKLARSPARIDYFATSLPAMLLFEDDIQLRQETTALFMQAQAFRGLGDEDKCRRLLDKVLERDPNHAMAADLLEEIETGI